MKRIQETSWVLYDFANSSYHLIVPTMLFPLIFKQFLWGNDATADLAWSLTVAIPIILSGLLAPLIGAFLDASGKLKVFFSFFVILTIATTYLLGLMPPDARYALIVVFSIGLMTFNLSQFTYNAFLPFQYGNKKSALISGIGWGLGYLGGILCMIPVYYLVKDSKLPDGIMNYQTAFLITATFFLIFSIPSLIYLRDTRDYGRSALIGGGYTRVITTIKNWRKYKSIFLFLIGLYLINDGIATLVFFTSLYATGDLGLTTKDVFVGFLIVQVVGIFATIIFAALAERLGYLNLFYLSVVWWIVNSFSFFLVQSAMQFYLLAVAVGLVIGTTPALARAIIAKAIDSEKDKAAEFFGFHAFASRVSSVFGPITFGAIATATGSQRLAILSLALFFATGLLFVLKSGISEKLSTTA